MNLTETAGGVVICKGKVLIVSQNGDSWSLPKGKVEPGESKKQAAEREIAEESGVNQLEFIKELGTYSRYRIGARGSGEDKNNLKNITIYLYKTNQIKLEPNDPHNPEAAWVAPSRVVDTLTHPKDKEFFAKITSTIQEFIA